MSENPWLNIPLDDYEGHMQAVGQTAALRQMFQDIYGYVRPRRLAVLGCTAGGDFDALDASITEFALGMDVNPQYVHAAAQRSARLRPPVYWVCGDVLTVDLPQAPFDLIHAALLLEYVDAAAFFARVGQWLAPNATLSIVTQQPTIGLAAVSKSPYDSSLQILAATMVLHSAEHISSIAAAEGYVLKSAGVVELTTGKALAHSIFQAAP